MKVVGVGGIGKIRWWPTSVGMEKEKEKEKEKESFSSNYVQQYNHSDSCSSSRWSARESFEYMYGRRPWEKVSLFYSDLVRSGGGYRSLSAALFIPLPLPVPVPVPEKQERNKSLTITENKHDEDPTQGQGRTGSKWERMTFKIVLSYHGGSFDGWQKQPGLNTVQGLVEKALGIFVDDRKAQKLRDNSLPIEACAAVAGRTDKGVTALQQQQVAAGKGSTDDLLQDASLPTSEMLTGIGLRRKGVVGHVAFGNFPCYIYNNMAHVKKRTPDWISVETWVII